MTENEVCMLSEEELEELKKKMNGKQVFQEDAGFREFGLKNPAEVIVGEDQQL